jgi:hypothetical protein
MIHEVSFRRVLATPAEIPTFAKTDKPDFIESASNLSYNEENHIDGYEESNLSNFECAE